MKRKTKLRIIPLWLLVNSLVLCQTADMTFKARWFYFVNEYVGQNRLSEIKENFRKKLSNGIQINRYTITTPLKEYIIANKYAFFDQLPASTRIINKIGWFPDTTLSYIQSQAAELRELTSTLGYHRVWWNLMFEYDQYGGPWQEGRMIDKSSRQKAYASWKDYYLTKVPPLEMYLQQQRVKRGMSIVAVSDFCATVHYSFDLGADMCLLERNNDELGDIQTGISFVRGAARQYDRPWGINVSNWRGATDSPTKFNDQMQLIGGWSPSYIRRHFYISYMSGAHVILNEALVYYDTKGNWPNPIAQVVEEFANFSLVRHPNIPPATVSTALMLDFYHGFEPKYGKYMQGNSVWYSRIPYDEGDFMAHNLFDFLFPEYWKSGTLPVDAPQTPSSYRKALASGADSRPWEPMGKSRYGDQFDVILSNAPLDALNNYRTIILVGTLRLSLGLKIRLETWIRGGGTLIINERHVEQQDESFIGARLLKKWERGAKSRWRGETSMIAEQPYRYHVVKPTTATTLAENEFRHPLILKRRIGSGEVIFVTPRFMQDASMTRILNVGERLIAKTVAQNAIAEVTGPFLIEYIVGKDNTRTVVTLVNNSNTDWNGTITIARPGTRFVIRELLSENRINYQLLTDDVIVPAFVPPYDLRVYTLETTR